MNTLFSKCSHQNSGTVPVPGKRSGPCTWAINGSWVLSDCAQCLSATIFCAGSQGPGLGCQVLYVLDTSFKVWSQLNIYFLYVSFSKVSNGVQYTQPLAVQPYAEVAVPPSIDTTQQLQQLQAQTLQLQPSEVLIQNGDTGPKRLHVTNIPFRFRDHDLVQMFGVCIHLLPMLFRKHYNLQ